MRLYAETNFVLELVLEQSGSDACSAMLDMAEGGLVELAIPAYALVEPLDTLARKKADRDSLQVASSKVLTELARSGRHSDDAGHVRDTLGGLIARSAEEEDRAVAHVTARIAACATVIPLTGKAIADSYGYRSFLKSQDSLVLASIYSHLGEQPGEACFVTIDKKDFASPDVTTVLEEHDCKLLWRFEDARDYVRSAIERAD